MNSAGKFEFPHNHSLPPNYIQITNLANEKQKFKDTLHEQAVEKQPCIQNVCKASVYKPPVTHKPSKEDVVKEATDFMKQYFESVQEKHPSNYESRVDEVTKSIAATGTYDLTEEELIFGAKTAWRNAPRCIGRIQWKNIKVFDQRKVATAEDMFKMICNHLEYTINGGNIRTAITIFPHLTDDKRPFRVWNAQLIKYAGYRNIDGSVTGDPSSVEFTNVCLRMGWEGNGTHFDVLPLVLQANGEDPELFEIPPQLVLEIVLKHPEYPWFEEMGLKWYAIPAVSNMSLHCGGLVFTACPFNGWYMSTKIGRNLCDTFRYNKTKDIGELMGLDTETVSSLWMDRVVVEVNIAILHSFQQQQVTITEHHSAADSFMHFMETEYKTRGGCPADWVWIIPPLTGSMTPVFHQEMLNYKLSPSFEYLEDAWCKHKWCKKETSGEKTLCRRASFSSAIRSISMTSKLMDEARSRRVPATVLYATETGRSERFAYQLSEILDAVFQPRVIRMDQYDMNCLNEEVLLFVVTSTFGEGAPPTNGVQFVNSLKEMQSQRGDGMSLNHIRFSVFGLGSRAYPKFCAVAHDVDETLHDLGLQRIYPLGVGDHLKGQENSFEKWARGVLKTSCSEMKLELQETDAPTLPAIASNLRLISTNIEEEEEDETNANKVISALAKIHAKDVVEMIVTGNKNLQSPDSERRTNLIQLSHDGTREQRFDHQPGDHVGVLPTNDEAMVGRIIDRVVFGTTNPNNIVRVEVRRQNKWIVENRLPPTTVRTALTYFLDITTPPDQMLLETLASFATDVTEKNKLNVLSQDIQKYEEWQRELYQPLDAFLEEFRSVKVPAALLLTQLPLLQPRYYSISSSALLHPGEVHMTVGIVQFNVGKDRKGPTRSGVCSSWLESRKYGDKVPVFHRSVENFHLPKHQCHPIILIGPGTGIAPFMAFFGQRRAEKSDKNTMLHGTCKGDIALYFGCRRSDHDHIFKTEIQSLVDDGVISNFHLALSREPDVPKKYVQDILINDASDVYRQIVDDGGHIYVCGDITMASQVEEVLVRILCQVGKMSLSEANDYIQKLCSFNRYHKDIYGTKL